MIHPAAAKVMEGDGSVRSKYGFSVKKASDGKCEIEMNVLSDWINAAGYTHGSVAYAIMDSACAYASASLNKLAVTINGNINYTCLLYTSPSPRDRTRSRMPSSA